MKTPNLKAFCIAGVFLFLYPPVHAQFSIIIDEIMADPSPQVALPNTEWIELKNISSIPFNVEGCRLGKSSSLSGPMPSLVLEPDSFLVVTSTSQVSSLAAFGNIISVTSFPSLSNDGDNIFIQSNTGAILHCINYSSAWYNNPVKKEGGWSLEMIDTKNPCTGAANWKASANPSGGTPGKGNSVDALNPDNEPPVMLRAYANDSITLTLIFNEPMNPATACLATNYSVSDGIGSPRLATMNLLTPEKVTLDLVTPVMRSNVYTVTASASSDCIGNVIDGNNQARVGLSSMPGSFDIAINEILFDPGPGSVDFLELYNRSNNIIDLGALSIANRSSLSGSINTPIKIPGENFLFFPGDYLVLTADPDFLGQHYTVKNPGAIIKMDLPALPDNEGSVLVFNGQGEVLDELAYSSKWHFPLIVDAEGISLERIDFNKPTYEKANWTSAASSAGFATPGYINSQVRSVTAVKGTIAIHPKMFSPDNDGYEDFTMVEFVFPEPGYIANITVYDAAGRQVRVLQRNTSTAATGSFRWDGLDDKQQRVAMGTYIIFTEIFNLKGQKNHFKNTVVVARKF